MGLILLVSNFYYWYGVVAGQVLGEAAMNRIAEAAMMMAG